MVPNLILATDSQIRMLVIATSASTGDLLDARISVSLQPSDLATCDLPWRMKTLVRSNLEDVGTRLLCRKVSDTSTYLFVIAGTRMRYEGMTNVYLQFHKSKGSVRHLLSQYPPFAEYLFDCFDPLAIHA